MTVREVLTRWSQRREEYELAGALVDAAKLITQFVTDIENAIRCEADNVLTLRGAAAKSGYSVDHLARMIREGRIANAGRRNAPRIREGDLPRRPKRFDRSSKRSYDVMTDARSLGVRR
jgi:hypothetical protein